MRFVRKPRREAGALLRKRGRPSDIKVGVLLPIPYRAAMASLFMHLAYNTLNSLDGVVAYRYVYDASSDVVEALENDAPPLRDLDIVMVSLPYELDYPYAVRALSIAGVEVWRKRRRKPIVVGGGIAAYSNPAPLCELLDAVAIGDGEGLIERIPYAVRDGGVDALCDLKHVLVYGVCEDRVPKNVAPFEEIPEAILRQAHPLDEEPVYGSGVRIELSKGCPRLCAFCLEGHVTKPFRFVKFEKLVKSIERALEFSPYRRLVLYSLSLLDVPHATKVLDFLAEQGIEASLPSLRPDLLNDEVVKLVKRLGQRTITIAPESMDPETACRIGKCYDIDSLRRTVEKAAEMGLNIKLYLIAGLPGEDEESFVDNVAKFIKGLSTRSRSRLRISVNPLVPKPWTPMQFLAPTYPEIVGKRVLKALRRLSIDWELLSWREGVTQAAIALGGRDLSKLLIESGLESKGLRALRNYAKKVVVRFEWMEMVDVGVSKDYLRRRFEYFSSLDPRFRTAGASNTA